ncbi:1530_t:CDS:2, partial [Cetraspora pellucida]
CCLCFAMNKNQDNFLTINKKLEDFFVINKENKEQENFTDKASNNFMNKEAIDSEFEIGQVENWIQYSDCILHDVTHKTNCYRMALALFVGFDITNIYPAVILINADPAVDAIIYQYSTKEIGAEEPFIVVDKFFIEVPKVLNFLVLYLYLKQEKSNFQAENLTTLEQKMMYGNIHGIYKKALHKALQNKTKSQYLIKLLENFVEDDNDKQYKLDDSQEIDSLDDEKKNSDPMILYIQTPKIHCGRGHPKGTKCLKSAHKVSKPMAN